MNSDSLDRARLTPWVAAGALGICFYVLTLIVPPAPIASPAADATLMERVFPGVPTWWVGGRLIALLLGAGLLAFALPMPAQAQGSARPDWETPPRAAQWLALAAAGAQAFVSPFAGGLSRWGQFAYLVGLFLPATILWLSVLRPAEIPRLVTRGRLVWLAALACWAVWRLTMVWDSPRLVNIADIWENHWLLAEAIAKQANFLTSWHHAGTANGAAFAAAADLTEMTRPPSARVLEAAGVFWVAVTGALAAWSVSKLISRRVAPVAAALVLMSPLSLTTTYFLFPFSFSVALAAAVLALVVGITQHRSVTALAMLGPIAGLAATQGYVALIVPIAATFVACTALRKPRAPWLPVATAVLSSAAVILPLLPAVDLNEFRGEVAGQMFAWTAMERFAYDQRDIWEYPAPFELATSGRPGRFDITVGGLLAPFAIPRTALRLWGDSVLEPWGAALTAVGVLLCLRWGARRRVYLAWVAAWLFMQLPVIFSSNYDRSSPLRNMALAVVSAPLAACLRSHLCSQCSRGAPRRSDVGGRDPVHAHRWLDLRRRQSPHPADFRSRLDAGGDAKERPARRCYRRRSTRIHFFSDSILCESVSRYAADRDQVRQPLQPAATRCG